MPSGKAYNVHHAVWLLYIHDYILYIKIIYFTSLHSPVLKFISNSSR